MKTRLVLAASCVFAGSLIANTAHSVDFDRFVTFTLDDSQITAIQSGGIDVFELFTGFSAPFSPAQLQNVDKINVYVNFVDQQGNKLYVILQDLGGQYLHPNGWQWFQAALALNTGTVSGTYVNGWIFTDSMPAFPGNFACCTRSATSQSTILSAGYGFNVTNSFIAVGGMRIQFNFNNFNDPVVITGGGGFDRMSLRIRSEGIILSRHPAPLVPVAIDVKPGTQPECGGAVPVAILGSDTLDVTQIDPATLSYEGLDVRQRGNGSLFCRVKDVNSDGYADFLCQYQDTTTEGTLTGALLGGTPIEGADTVCVVN